MSDIEIVGLKRETTFTIELPERAVRALALIGDFGERALEKAVATVLSETEAKRHAGGLADLQRIGGVAHAVLNRLADARHVANGDKVALWKKDVESASQQNAGAK